MSCQSLDSLGRRPQDFDHNEVADSHEESRNKEKREELVERDCNRDTVVTVNAVVDGDGCRVVEVREGLYTLVRSRAKLRSQAERRREQTFV